MEENKEQVSNGQDEKNKNENIDLQAKIREFELAGRFDEDLLENPPTKILMPEDVDYLRKKISSKIKRNFYYFLARKFLNKLLKTQTLIIKEIKGLENYTKLDSGAILTCNHFSALDTFANEYLYDMSKHKKRKLFRVIREGNYTNFPGLFGKIMRHCNTLPLSSNKDTMKNFVRSLNHVLQKGNFVLVYAEQGMWPNYKKPRPLKKSAFKMAVTNNVPVLPIFITMEDTDIVGMDGQKSQAFTIHVGKPIYADSNLSLQENIENMKNENFTVWKNIYEETYKIPLTYLCDKK